MEVILAVLAALEGLLERLRLVLGRLEGILDRLGSVLKLLCGLRVWQTCSRPVARVWHGGGHAEGSY